MKKIMYRDAISSALAEEMRRDEKVFVMGEDVAITGGVYKATRGLLEEFGPQRVRNTPLSEIAIAGVATGAAMAGARPVAEIMHIDFTGCCMDILLNQMSKMYYKTNGKVSVHGPANTGRTRKVKRLHSVSESRGALHPHSRTKGGHAVYSLRCKGVA